MVHMDRHTDMHNASPCDREECSLD